ncbi:MAG: TIGR04283 family arsenosugar biosynthesis glycosyltransferase [Acidobacteria bacterium]|nr:TIGR04283 family arsenosugar biosynthesis glycosyltransferase [Acidobacteriota bacterium]
MSGVANTRRISIIIPTLNEAANIEATLASTRSASDVEVIVVDGGSRDNTADLARAGGAKVLTTDAGRAGQMNAGAAAAKGAVLLFLHADTRLPERFDESIGQVLLRPSTVAGAFQLRIEGSEWGLRIIERLANWRSHHWQMPYGDQAIFLRTETFHDIGGFPDLPIMEDFELIRRLRRRGRIAIVPVPIVTSARRWEKMGVLKTTFINQAMIIAHLMGVSPARLARWYYGSPSAGDGHRREDEIQKPHLRSHVYDSEKQWQWPKVGSDHDVRC